LRKPLPRLATSLVLAALLSCAAFLLFWRLGASTFHSGDEAFHAECAREMMERGDYLTPYYAGEPFLEKPPAKMWLIIAGFRLLGVNEWGARLSSAIVALGAVAATVALGRALFGIGTGLLAGAILATSVQFVHEHCGRTAEMEPETVFLVTVSLLLVHRMTREPRWAWGLGAALGALILVKGPIALPVLAIAALYLPACRPLPSNTGRHLLLGTVVMLAVALPWHVLMLKAHGDAFREIYLQGQVLGRLTGRPPESVVSEVHGISASARPFYYAPVLFSSLFPWSLVAVPALLAGIATAVRRPDREVRLLVLWFLVFAATITFANAKFAWYAVPLLPAVALLTARFVDRLSAVDRKMPVRIGAVMVLALSLLWAPAPRYAPYAREATLWPYRDPSLATIPTLSRADIGSWIPLAATVLFLAAADGVAWRVRRVRPVHLVAGSLLITGACHAALPLRGVDNRDFFATGFADTGHALRDRGLEAARVLVLDDETLDLAFKWPAFFYLYGITDGGKAPVARLTDASGKWQDRQVLRSGVVMLGQPRWADELRAAGRFEELYRGPHLYAAYVP